jgi:hypothetical protein
MMRQAVIASMSCAPEGFAAAASCCIVMVSTVTQVARCPTVVETGVPRSAVLISPYPAPPPTAGPFVCVLRRAKRRAPPVRRGE